MRTILNHQNAEDKICYFRQKITLSHPINVSPPSTPKEAYQCTSAEQETSFDYDASWDTNNGLNRLQQFKQRIALSIPSRFSKGHSGKLIDVQISPLSPVSDHHKKKHNPITLSIFAQRKRAQTICSKVLQKYIKRKQ